MAQSHPALAPGNVAVITGGASGIGLATGRRLAAMGLAVVLVDRDEARVRDAASEIGGDASGLATDVADAGAVAALARLVADRHGPVSFLMNNAAVDGGGDALADPAGWSRVLGVNLHGVIHGVQSFVPAMAAGGAPGLVVNTGSKQGITTPPGDTAYNVSKAGVKVLTEGLAHTLRSREGCQVSAHLLIPGFTFTGLTKGATTKPPGAWSADQVVDRLFAGIEAGDFYIWCEDNETTRERDGKRVFWAAHDVIESRPALSRWHPEWKERFERFMG